MYYGRVPERLDQYVIYTNKGKQYRTLFADELYTYPEYLNLKRKCSNMPFLEWYEIPKSKTVWFMGARLPIITDTGRYRGEQVLFEDVYYHYNFSS